MNIYDAIEIGKKNTQNPTNTQPTPPNLANTKQATESAPSFEAVTISVGGTSHRINCPSDGVNNLKATATYLDDKISSLRHDFKSRTPSNEELLVLVSLELCDQIKDLQQELSQLQDERHQSQILLKHIIDSARSVI